MVAVGVVELALVHEGVVVGVTDPPAGGAGALGELVDRLPAAEPPTAAYIARLPSMTYWSGAIAKHDTLSSDISVFSAQPSAV